MGWRYRCSVLQCTQLSWQGFFQRRKLLSPHCPAYVLSYVDHIAKIALADYIACFLFVNFFSLSCRSRVAIELLTTLILSNSLRYSDSLWHLRLSSLPLKATLTQIDGFPFRFAVHAQFPGISGRFDNAYSYEITGPKISLWTFELPCRHLLPIFNNLLFSTQDSTGLPYQVRTTSNFGTSLDNVLASGKRTFMIYQSVTFAIRYQSPRCSQLRWNVAGPRLS